MDLSIAFTIVELIILAFVSSLEATSIGFAAPLVHLTSPKHPLYNPHATPKDIIKQKLRISIERNRYFSQQRRHFGIQAVPPLESDVVIYYSIGTPPVEQVAIFDTASDLLWLQCQPCIQCFNQSSPFFEPQKSSTYHSIGCLSENCKGDYGFQCLNESCKYKISYADGSYSHGTVATDTLTLPEYEYSPEFIRRDTLFGCADYNKDQFSIGTSGILGLTNSSLSLIGQTHVDAFSYCKSDDGGYIRFGSTATLVGLTTPLFTNSFQRYQVILLGIAVDYKNTVVKLDIPGDVFKAVENNYNTGVIIDSGTAYTLLNPVAYEALRNKVQQLLVGSMSQLNADYSTICFTGKGNTTLKLESMPRVQFLFDTDTTIALPKENVWTDEGQDGSICLNIFRNDNNKTTIGSEQLKDYNVGYDLKQNLLWLDHQLSCDF